MHANNHHNVRKHKALYKSINFYEEKKTTDTRSTAKQKRKKTYADIVCVCVYV